MDIFSALTALASFTVGPAISHATCPEQVVTFDEVPGLSVRFPEQGCVVDRRDVPDFTYEVVYTGPEQSVTTEGWCQSASPSGFLQSHLITVGEVSRDDAPFGLCGPQKPQSHPVRGDELATFSWEPQGRNGGGCIIRDDGPEMLPGKGSFEVRLVGTVDGQDLDLVASWPFELR